MNICVFDTETTSLDKPFCYNIGYVIIDSDGWAELCRRSFVVEQVWHNLPLFSTAYYAEKRPLYVAAMRSRMTTLDKFGYICRQMSRDFMQYNVDTAFAYNSSFDERVFDFNCDWFKCINPFDNVNIKDIRGFAHYFLVDDVFKTFCEENNLFTDTGNYSTTAETMYKYISENLDFIEDHTALEDSIIEAAILGACVDNGADLNRNYAAFRSIERPQKKTLQIISADTDEVYKFEYTKIRINKDKTKITLQ